MVVPTYGGQPMEISFVIELLKLVEAIAKIIKFIVETLKKHEKKPP